MSDKCFLDTNILVYSCIENENIKHEAALKLLMENRRNHLFVSTQVLSELYSALTKNGIKGAFVKKCIYDMASKFNIAIITFETIKLCIEIKERYGFSYWDSQVLAAAIENECSIVYSEDMRHDQIVNGSVKIVNPFLK
jgi:predicted nucleic acid-binding protein